MPSRGVWLRVSGERWKNIGWKIGLSGPAAWQHWSAALCVIAMTLNGERVATSGFWRPRSPSLAAIRLPRLWSSKAEVPRTRIWALFGGRTSANQGTDRKRLHNPNKRRSQTPSQGAGEMEMGRRGNGLPPSLSDRLNQGYLILTIRAIWRSRLK
jgi:hypothetical protein